MWTGPGRGRLTFAVSVVLSMVGLAFAMRGLPVGTAYAVWVGIGASLTVGYGMVTGAEPVSVTRVRVHNPVPHAISSTRPRGFSASTSRAICSWSRQIDEAGWSMVRVDPDFSQRFTARFAGPDAMETDGQYSDDGGTTWRDDFTMSCRRIA